MIEFVLIGVIIILGVILFFSIKHSLELESKISELSFLKRSQSVKYGQLTEQWIPFSNKYPFDSQNFRFIGKPIDGISFEENKIVFVEFKTASSKLSNSQKRIKELVLNKKIEWLELRIK